MEKVKTILVKFYTKLKSDTLTTGKKFDESTHRVAKGFTNFG